ncbi:MFS transporter [Amycolatopsis palatopharyngis]|uniref:MFS transporter n=1 Tax=Amycolatopsis palatopharyngis TaxID=187982 RepID=UPI000E24E2F0|nr:MFS transporter [Amycolatopsis palatopharyngis]
MKPDGLAATIQEPARVRWAVVVLAFLAVLLDGFDTATLAVVVPTLANEWGVGASEFTYPLVLTNIGVVVGYLCCGAAGARIGRRRLLLGGVVGFAVFTLLTAVVLPMQSIAALSVTRLLTGIGLGVVLPVAVSLTTDHSPARRRELVSVTVTLGLASGLTLGGFAGGRLIENLGTAGVFWLAGLLPLALVIPMARVITEPPQAGPGSAARRDASVSRLFHPALRGDTVLLWTFSFLVFLAAYTLTSWVPTLLVGYGFSPSDAPLGLAFLSLGGVVGGILLLPLTARIGIVRALILMPVLGIVCIAAAARLELNDVALLLVLGGAGAGITAGQIGQLTLAVALYPVRTRTTGVGWAAALGRAGSIIGPGAAGILIGLAISERDIILLTTAPVLVAAACATALWRRRTRTRAPAAPSEVDEHA